jgi:hypothetical protein
MTGRWAKRWKLALTVRPGEELGHCVLVQNVLVHCVLADAAGFGATAGATWAAGGRGLAAGACRQCAHESIAMDSTIESNAME